MTSAAGILSAGYETRICLRLVESKCSSSARKNDGLFPVAEAFFGLGCDFLLMELF